MKITDRESTELIDQARKWQESPETMLEWINQERLLYIQVLSQIVKNPTFSRNSRTNQIAAVRELSKLFDAYERAIDSKIEREAKLRQVGIPVAGDSDGGRSGDGGDTRRRSRRKN